MISAAWSPLGAGFLSGIGLWLSGMANPRKVLDFLDIAGNWDPSLLLVMGGAVAVTAIFFRPLLRKKQVSFERTVIDMALVIGAAVFGVGWESAATVRGPRSPRSRISARRRSCSARR